MPFERPCAILDFKISCSYSKLLATSEATGPTVAFSVHGSPRSSTTVIWQKKRSCGRLSALTMSMGEGEAVWYIVEGVCEEEDLLRGEDLQKYREDGRLRRARTKSKRDKSAKTAKKHRKGPPASRDQITVEASGSERADRSASRKNNNTVETSGSYHADSPDSRNGSTVETSDSDQADSPASQDNFTSDEGDHERATFPANQDDFTMEASNSEEEKLKRRNRLRAKSKPSGSVAATFKASREVSVRRAALITWMKRKRSARRLRANGATTTRTVSAPRERLPGPTDDLGGKVLRSIMRYG